MRPSASGGITRTGEGRPEKDAQEAWHSYRKLTKSKEKEWLPTPFLVPAETQPLAGAPEKTELFQLQQFTNLHRMLAS